MVYFFKSNIKTLISIPSMKRILLLCGIAVMFSYTLLAQTYTISGHIQDSSSGEQLLGATIYCEDLREGVMANAYGFYSLTIPSGKHQILVTYIGYASQRFEVDSDSNLRMDIDLIAGTQLSEAVVIGEEFNRIEDQVQMSKMYVPIDQIKRLPAIGGEVDLLKILQLLPGVQSGGEGTSGLYVRGGSPDQNLMLLDGVPLYSVNHLFGFFSVFNADAVKNMSITKGGFPARYGGRLSSILEINMKDGHMKSYHVDATVSVIASKVTIEGPLVEDKASFMISGRRTYLDLLVSPLIQLANSDQETQTSPRYFFGDFNGKINWKVTENDRIYFSAFTGLDDFGVGIEDNFGENQSLLDFGLDWRNSIQALRWNHHWGPRLFSNTTLTHSRYDFNTGFDITDISESNDSLRFASLYNSGINDFSGKIDYEFTPNARHSIRFGSHVTRHSFSPGATALEIDLGSSTSVLDTIIGASQISSLEGSIYLEDEFELGERAKINVGFHGAALDVQDTTYYSLQPRLAVNYKLNNGLAIKASYAEMTQFINLLTNEGLGLPTDLWVPSTNLIRPQNSWQVAIGVATTVSKSIELSLEGYYKSMDGLLSYQEGASFFDDNADWENKVTQGTGRSYGAEILIQKKKGRATGWIGYTLSWSDRQFDEINSGNRYPFTYDRRHDISLVLNYEIDDKWNFSYVYVYGTGRALTLSDASFMTYVNAGVEQNIMPISAQVPSAKNSYRMSAYSRTDVSLTRTKYKANSTRELIFSVYNLTNHLNPFFSILDTDASGNAVVTEYGIFPIIPSIALRYSF